MSKADTLTARWSKRERDLVFHYPTRKVDGAWLYYWLCVARAGGQSAHDTFTHELEERGFDLTTLKVSVKLKRRVHVCGQDEACDTECVSVSARRTKR